MFLTGNPDSDGLPTLSTWLLALRLGVVERIRFALFSMAIGLRPIIILLGSGELRFQRVDEWLLPRLLNSCGGHFLEVGTDLGLDGIEVSRSWSRTWSTENIHFKSSNTPRHNYKPWFHIGGFISLTESLVPARLLAYGSNPWFAECQLSTLDCFSIACWRNRCWMPFIFHFCSTNFYFLFTVFLFVFFSLFLLFSQFVTSSRLCSNLYFYTINENCKQFSICKTSLSISYAQKHSETFLSQKNYVEIDKW